MPEEDGLSLGTPGVPMLFFFCISCHWALAASILAWALVCKPQPVPVQLPLKEDTSSPEVEGGVILLQGMEKNGAGREEVFHCPRPGIQFFLSSGTG